MLLACALAVVVAAPGTEAVAARWEAGEVIVRFKPGVDGAERSALRRAQGTKVERVLPLARTQVLELPEGVPVASAVRRLERDPRVEWAEPNYVVRARDTVPGFFDWQWALDNVAQFAGGAEDADIDAVEAWQEKLAVSPGVTVAVVDTGVDLDHPELAGRIAADLTGTDLVDGDDYPDDLNGHGTHVAGIIGARADDNAGVTGVTHDVEILPLRALGADGTGTLDELVDAIDVAAEKGAAIVNASLGASGSFPEALHDAISEHPEVLFVVAAGNGGEDGIGDDNDVVGDWPCNYQPPAGKPDNVICVAASDDRDLPAEFTNFGAVNVDLAAPGVGILSTWPLDLAPWPLDLAPEAFGQQGYDIQGYDILDGTSMATPHVAGAAALVLAQSHRERSPLDAVGVRQRLLETVDRSACWTGLTVTGGRLNLARALGVVDEELLGPGPTADACPIDPEEFRDGRTQATDAGDDDSPGGSDPPAQSPPPWWDDEPTTEPGSDDGDDPTAGDADAEEIDATPPRVSVRAARTSRARTLLRRGLRMRVRCNEGCRLRAELLIGRGTARKLRIKGRRAGRYVRLGSTSRRLRRAGTATLTTRVGRSARAGLRRARRVKLVLRVVSTDASGNTRVTRRSLIVRR